MSNALLILVATVVVASLVALAVIVGSSVEKRVAKCSAAGGVPTTIRGDVVCFAPGVVVKP